MEKIISLFKRNYEPGPLGAMDVVANGLGCTIINEVTPGAEWVLNGEGEATRKFDGACCKIEGGVFYRRHELRNGAAVPTGFVSCAMMDEKTLKCQGWVPVDPLATGDKWLMDAVANASAVLVDGTYEACGPKIQGNPEGFVNHTLIRHGRFLLPYAPRDFEGIRAYLRTGVYEGIVWHHEDGRMVKVKARDFGIKRTNLSP